MPKILLILLLNLVLPTAALAKTFKLGADAPAASITLPDAWNVDTHEGGVEAVSPAPEIYLSAEAITAEDLKDAGQEVARSLAEQKIKLKADSKKQAQITVAGHTGAEISWDATDEDGPTQVHLVVVQVAPGEAVLVLRWGSADDEKSHAAEIDGIVKSIAAAKK